MKIRMADGMTVTVHGNTKQGSESNAMNYQKCVLAATAKRRSSEFMPSDTFSPTCVLPFINCRIDGECYQTEAETGPPRVREIKESSEA